MNSTKDYSNLNIEDIKDYRLYTIRSGSRAYGTHHEKSDYDEKGVYMLPKEAVMSYRKPKDQVDSDKHDTTYYSVYRFLELLSTANPNLIEMLWSSEQDILYKKPIFDKILSKRNVFLTKQAYNSHAKYAESQINKAKGANKRVNNPFSEKVPSHEDFCYWLPLGKRNGFETRPIKIDNDFLKQHHVSKLEHGHNMFRLYKYENVCKGVFAGSQIVPQSIPIEDEETNFNGILIYNEDAFKKTKNEWKQYWEWKRNRNEERWISQENGERNFDAKNMCHCVRLLYSAVSIFKNGEPIVRFEGEKLQMLRDIRFTNKYDYDFILKLANDLLTECEELKNKSSLPEKINENEIEIIIKDLYGD